MMLLLLAFPFLVSIIFNTLPDWNGIFKGLVATDKRLAPEDIVVGRHVMTCCADDIQYCGLACVLPQAMDLQTRDWVMITAKVQFQKHRIYKGKGPVLVAQRVIIGEPPEEQLATFY